MSERVEALMVIVLTAYRQSIRPIEEHGNKVCPVILMTLHTLPDVFNLRHQPTHQTSSLNLIDRTPPCRSILVCR